MRKVLTPIKIISFDFDGVFPMGKRKYNYEESLYRNLRTKLGKNNVDKKEMYGLFADFIQHDRAERIFHKSGRLIPYFENYLRNKGIKHLYADEIVLDALFDSNTMYPLTENLASIFKFFATREIKVALVSDSIFPTLMRRIMLQNWGLLQYFDLVLTSQEHDRKSGHKIFKKLINHFEAKPSEILHVGDKLSDDIILAKKVGLQTCLLLNESANEDTASIKPDFTIKNLKELKQIIEVRALLQSKLNSVNILPMKTYLQRDKIFSKQ
ncbi:HAD family hydrolase [Candidatus Giovannonibacteria bacterium]|nr:HAD family hydrolase [Candidatus Giovannonibacteria bacterium]